MDIVSFRELCIRQKGVTEEFPFDQETLVFKVMGKMFALTNVDNFTSVNLKCDPEEAVMLREQYNSIKPGYHMSKKHWNTVLMDGSLRDNMITKMTLDSYNLVVEGLPKKVKTELSEMTDQA